MPERVVAAERAAAARGFTKSWPPEVGRLSAVAAAGTPGGVIAESGTGAGVGIRLFDLTHPDLTHPDLTHPGLAAAEVPTTPTSSAILATRKDRTDRKERSSW
ncbi:hypothetical protein PUR71_12465 [Streptomyces sp. SP17BM10]|uniref:hypothetical protein n=1 Tax=Streptomyces sp. SP17BM10 TaxID=3002530 RepID=UPI002E787209|nr:hypothetical protein [Streptomyces sp. SP17BM10]MEE1783714.1 hypothetical protein [Streptomyces sp. SP17BM10]